MTLDSSFAHAARIEKAAPGKCRICGHVLTDPKSIALGIGKSHLKSKSPGVIARVDKYLASKHTTRTAAEAFAAGKSSPPFKPDPSTVVARGGRVAVPRDLSSTKPPSPRRRRYLDNMSWDDPEMDNLTAGEKDYLGIMRHSQSDLRARRGDNKTSVVSSLGRLKNRRNLTSVISRANTTPARRRRSSEANYTEITAAEAEKLRGGNSRDGYLGTADGKHYRITTERPTTNAPGYSERLKNLNLTHDEFMALPTDQRQKYVADQNKGAIRFSSSDSPAEHASKMKEHNARMLASSDPYLKRRGQVAQIVDQIDTLQTRLKHDKGLTAADRKSMNKLIDNLHKRASRLEREANDINDKA